MRHTARYCGAPPRAGRGWPAIAVIAVVVVELSYCGVPPDIAAHLHGQVEVGQGGGADAREVGVVDGAHA